LDHLYQPSKFPFLESVSIFGNYQKRKFNPKMIFGLPIPAIKLSIFGNFQKRKFYSKMVFGSHMQAIKISFFGNVTCLHKPSKNSFFGNPIPK